MLKEFRSTGIPQPQLSVSHNRNTSYMIAAPGLGRHIIITDLMNSAGGSSGQSYCEGTDSVKTDADVICHMPDEGVCNLTSPIRVAENKAVWMIADNMSSTLCYYIEDRRQST